MTEQPGCGDMTNSQHSVKIIQHERLEVIPHGRWVLAPHLILLSGLLNARMAHSGGLLYFPGDSDEASLNPALNVAMLMTRYASSDLASSTNKRDQYQEFAQSQVDYALGNNPMFGASLQTPSTCLS